MPDNIRATFVSGNLVWKETVIGNGAQVHFGVDDDGLDVKFFGATSGAYMLWDESANALLFAGGAKPTPAANDGCALGSATLSFSDLFLASGGVINWNNGDVLLTHSSDTLTLSGGGFAISNTTKAIDINCTAIGATGRTAKLAGAVANPNFGDGYGGVEIELDITGTVAGQTTGLSNWINFAASSSGGGQKIIAQDNGIYVPATGTPMSASTAIIGMRMQYVAEGGGNPGKLYLFDTNIYDNALTALFQVNALADMGGSTGAASGNDYKVPLFHDYTANQTWYINIYHT